MFGFNCRTCQSDPSVKRLWGCDEPTQAAVWADEEDTYFSCPLALIGDGVVAWYTRWSYDKETGTGLTYDKQSCRYIDASFCYQNALTMYANSKTKKGRGPSMKEQSQWLRQ